MRNFDYSNLKNRTWDNEILSYVPKIHEFKGKQELYFRQKPVELERLVEIAKVQIIATLFVNVNSINAGQFCDTLANNDNSLNAS